MIPQPSITAWSARAPWPEPNQVEQDLILSRLMVEIANHELLGPELAMRGGTCLHKLHLPQPLRYSDDLDYVRRSRSPIKPYMAALREIATGAGLVEHHYAQAGEMVHMIFDAGRLAPGFAASVGKGLPAPGADGRVSGFGPATLLCESADLGEDEPVQVELVAVCDALVESSQPVAIEPANRGRVESGVRHADKPRDHRGVLLGEVEAVGVEVEKARVPLLPDELPAFFRELAEAQKPEREQLSDPLVVPVG